MVQQMFQHTDPIRPIACHMLLGGLPLFGSVSFLQLVCLIAHCGRQVMVPWVTRRTDPIMATGWHMLLGGLPLLALALVREGPLLATRLPQLTGTQSPLSTLFRQPMAQ